MTLCRLVAILCLAVSVSQSQDNCLGPGFTETIPARQEWSKYSTTVVEPGDAVIYSSLSFACNGTLESLTIPFEVRGSVYTNLDQYLLIWVSVWRFNETGYYRVREFQGRVDVMSTLQSSQVLSDNDTLQDNVTITPHQLEVLAKDILAFRSLLPNETTGQPTIYRHLPLLYKPGPSPGTFTPIVSAKLEASSGPVTALSQVAGCNSSVTALGVLFALSLLLLLVLTAVVVVQAVMLKRARSGKMTTQENIYYNGVSHYPPGSAGATTSTLSLPVANETDPAMAAAVPSRVVSGTQSISNRTQQGRVRQEAGEQYQYVYVPNSRQRNDPNAIYGTVEGEGIYATLNDGHYEMDINATYWSPAQTTEAIFDQMSKVMYLEIPHSSLKKERKLGEGEFGEVFKGQWTSPAKTLTVALKSLKSSASDEERVKLLQEAAIMGQFIHPHIVRLYGVVTLSEPVMIVMELLEGSDLRNHLLKLRTMRSEVRQLPKQLLRFCQEIAGAMEYLSKKGFIHRDLAARNILLTTDMKCKIADFGMSHDMEEDYYYKVKGGMIPVKWTAPEAILYRKYTTKSDVWSYGMVMYEIWSLGCKPFEEFNIEEVVQALNTDYCQPPPPGCPRGVYTIMVKCWHPDYHSRVSFTEVMQYLNYDQRSLLKMDPRDETGTPLSLTLGAPLEHGLELHKDLQDTYKK